MKSTTAILLPLYLAATSLVQAQGPVVKTPTTKATTKQYIYPWKMNITATIFWVGEKPTKNNPTPNHASSWDTKWQENFGGYDDPNHRAKVGYRPAAFTPKLNPFYIALPFNDRIDHKYIKPETSRVIKWYCPTKVQKGKSCCKGRWVQIVYGKKYCFAQWEDCGPFNTTDWEYVFGNKRPKNSKNNSAGIDLSPAIRDYLGLKSGAKVHWRFVEDAHVKPGPWLTYGPKTIQTQPKEDRLTKLRREIAEMEKKRTEEYRKRKGL